MSWSFNSNIFDVSLGYQIKTDLRKNDLYETLKYNFNHMFKQVVGGKMTESGRLCAFITKVKKGSLADTVGHLRPGRRTVLNFLIEKG